MRQNETNRPGKCESWCQCIVYTSYMRKELKGIYVHPIWYRLKSNLINQKLCIPEPESEYTNIRTNEEASSSSIYMCLYVMWIRIDSRCSCQHQYYYLRYLKLPFNDFTPDEILSLLSHFFFFSISPWYIYDMAYPGSFIFIITYTRRVCWHAAWETKSSHEFTYST
jgi:hypothetical protein